MEALFASLLGGDALRRRLLAVIAEAADLAAAIKIDLHIMTFAFTDEAVANALAEAAARQPRLTVRIIADWSQRTLARGQQVGRLTRLGLPNLHVRYKNDQPYLWDEAAAHMRWSYRASRGLLHHKTLSVLADGRPWRLVCGSFNWTATAARSYENLLVLTPEQRDLRRLMSRIELEFEALWSDGRATLSVAEADLHYQAIVEAYGHDPTAAPAAIGGLARGHGAPLRILATDDGALACETDDTNHSGEPPCSAHASALIAFNARRSDDAESARGYAECNRTQRFVLCTPSGKARRVPLTITNLALDTIFSAAPGDTLKIAMYGLSARVAEYGALLDAARRGVRVFVLLDRAVGLDLSDRLKATSQRADLPLEVRTTSRMMHEKYMIIPESSTVLTGTANMTTDATLRHSEHRIRIRGNEDITRQFCADFDTIWNRL